MGASKISVYLLDDHELVREGIRNLLKKELNVALVGDTGNAEIAIEEINKLDPDVVILDIYLHESKVNGLDVAQQIKASMPDKPIIILTGTDSILPAVEALENDICSFITKECSKKVLIEAIKLASDGINVWDRKMLHGAVKYISKHATRGEIEEQTSVPCLDNLTANEIRVFELLRKGYSNKDICRELKYSDASTKKYVHNCIQKLGVKSRVQVALVETQEI